MFQNNSSEMKTVVESFFVEETLELIYDNEQLDKYNSLVKELGINGTSSIQSKDKSPIPFLHMKTSLENIFSTLCPVSVDFKDYNLTPIPVEILELIALSVREKYFSKIEIWYDDKSPDPVCVGFGPTWFIDNANGGRYSTTLAFNSKDECQQYIDNNSLPDGCKPYQYTWTVNKYLIGKWGDVKHSFDELRKMAKERYIETQGASLRKQIKDYQRQLDDLELTAVERFN